MIRVEKGNVVLHVMDDEMRHYLQLGYNVTDEEGNILQAAVPRDLGTLQQFYVEGTRKIAALEAQIAELKAPKSKPVEDTEKKSRKKAE